MIDFKVKLLYPDAQAPVKAHDDDACYDVFAHSFWMWKDHVKKLIEMREDEIDMVPFVRYLIKTGIQVSIPKGYETQVRSRSGLSLKEGVIINNSPGTIDFNYTGEVGVIMMATRDGYWPTKIKKGDRVAQLAIREVPDSRVVLVDKIEETERGGAGFGSTGK